LIIWFSTLLVSWRKYKYL